MSLHCIPLFYEWKIMMNSITITNICRQLYRKYIG